MLIATLGGVGCKRSSKELYEAAARGDASRTAKLLKDGAHPDSQKSSSLLGAEIESTALHAASHAGHLEVVRLLLEAGADVNAVSSLGRESALLKASIAGRAEVAQALLEAGAEVDLPNKWKKTPLMWAADEAHPGVIEVLLGAGADPSKRDEDGRTALDFAKDGGASKEREAVIAMLEKHAG